MRMLLLAAAAVGLGATQLVAQPTGGQFRQPSITPVPAVADRNAPPQAKRPPPPPTAPDGAFPRGGPPPRHVPPAPPPQPRFVPPPPPPPQPRSEPRYQPRPEPRYYPPRAEPRYVPGPRYEPVPRYAPPPPVVIGPPIYGPPPGWRHRRGYGWCRAKAERLYEFEYRMQLDGRVSRDEMRIANALRADLQRSCGGGRWAPDRGWYYR